MKQLAAGVLGTGAVVGAVLLLNSCAIEPGTIFVSPDIPGARYAGNKACRDCHSEIVRRYPASPHARVGLKVAGLKDETGCEICHGPGSLHIQAGGGAKFIVNPRKDPAGCFQCHIEIQAEFSLPQHHPVPEGRMNCVQCHDPHGSDIFKPAGGLAMARLNEACAQCHRQQTQPVVFEHEALREGCTVCHAPHGSINRMMLNEADANLCLRCHAQNQRNSGPSEILIGSIPHSAFLRRASCWAAGCHSSIHGSNVDPRLRF